MKAAKDNLKLGDEIIFIPCVGSSLQYTVVRMNDKSVWVSAGRNFTYRKSWQSISKYDILNVSEKCI